MSAASSTDHMYVATGDDLKQLSEPQWIEESVNVFTGNFTCASDKEKLVDVVMALYSFCISCGRYSPTPSTGRDQLHDAAAEGTERRLWLAALIERNRKMCFPPEWFGDSIEVIEMEIQKALEGNASSTFSSVAFDLSLIHI